MGELFDDADLAMADSFAAELNRLAGTKVKLYSVRLGHAVDPVYDEPSKQHGYDPLYGEVTGQTEPTPPEEQVEWGFEGPWEFFVSLEFEEEQNSDTNIEESIQTDWDAVAWLARSDLEKIGCPYPKKGDVLQTDVEKWRTKGDDPIFFDVISADRSGAMGDTQSYVNMRLNLKRRTKFTPGRRVGQVDDETEE